MADYIDREKLLKSIPSVKDDKTISLFGAVADMICIVNSVQKEDVAPVVHGKWIIPHWRNSTYCAQCSICGEEAQHGEYKGVQKYYKLCPYCGAKMDAK